MAEYPAHVQTSVHMLAILGNGFIVTAMLWGGAMAHLIDRQLKKAALFFVVCAALTSIGLIHSVHLDGSMYLPWAVGDGAHHMGLIVAGYGVLAAFFVAMSFTPSAREAQP